MDHAATAVMEEYPDIILAFGESDEYRLVYALRYTSHSPQSASGPYMRVISIPLGMPTVGALPCNSDQWSTHSFLLRRQTTLYNRRQAKIVSTLTSYFTSCYVFHWSRYFPDITLRYPPSFDGRIVLYPTHREVRDYFAWRQADSKILSL
jgi:tRNA(His) guanylyltransferase